MINVLIIRLWPKFCHVSNLIRFEIQEWKTNSRPFLSPSCLQPPQCFLSLEFCQTLKTCNASEAASCTGEQGPQQLHELGRNESHRNLKVVLSGRGQVAQLLFRAEEKQPHVGRASVSPPVQSPSEWTCCAGGGWGEVLVHTGITCCVYYFFSINSKSCVCCKDSTVIDIIQGKIFRSFWESLLNCHISGMI